jgi:hypothetical protein
MDTASWSLMELGEGLLGLVSDQRAFRDFSSRIVRLSTRTGVGPCRKCFLLMLNCAFFGRLFPIVSAFISAGGRAMPLSCFRRPRGSLAIETLLALPLIALVFLFFLQIAWVAFGQFTLWRAAAQAARVGAISSIDLDMMHRRLSDVMSRTKVIRAAEPTWTDVVAHRLKSFSGHQVDRLLGHVTIRVLSPNSQGFDDWHDDQTGLLPAPVRVSNPMERQPRHGVLDHKDGLARGKVSMQSFLDATTLKIDVRYGLPLEVPLVGRLLAKTIAWSQGCASEPVESFGLLRQGPVDSRGLGVLPSSSGCSALVAVNGEKPRFFLRAVGVAQMQSDTPRDRIL